jgi:drug/metabolite transporter (DMT)-like permease
MLWIIDLVLLAALWGASFLLMRLGGAEFGALPTAFLRVTIGGLCLLPLVLRHNHGAYLKTRSGQFLWLGTLNSAIPFTLFSLAVMAISTSLTSVLNATTPLWAALIAWLWLGDALGARRWLGLVIGAAGTAMLAYDKSALAPVAALSTSETIFGIHAQTLAVAACLLATFCYGIAANYTKKNFATLPPLVLATASQFGAAVFLVIPAIVLWPRTMPSAQAWLAVVALGVFCTGIAYALYFRLIASAGAPRTLTVTFLIPVFAMAYGSLFLNERITQGMVLWGGVILVGTAIAVYPAKSGAK